jgi:hypothetical protein
MLEKAKNRKIFYFLVFIVLGFSLCFPIVSATSYFTLTDTEFKKHQYSSAAGASYSTLHDAISATSLSSGFEVTIDCDDETDKYNILNRAYVKFNIAGYDVNDISSAILSIQFDQAYHYISDTDEIRIVAFQPTSTTVSVDDYNNYNTSILLSNSEITTYNATIGWNNFTIDLDALELIWKDYTDTLYFGAILDSDKINVVPGYISGISNQANHVRASDFKLYLTLSDAPDVDTDIIADITSGETPLDVTFTDNSSGWKESYPYPTYILYFGDGTSISGERQYTGEHWYHEYSTEYDSRIFNVTYIITDGVYSDTDTEFITVSSNTDNFYVHVSGLNTAPISGANVSIWYNGEYQDSEASSSIGKAYFTIPENRLITGTVTKPGYQDATFSQYVGTTDTFKVVTLYLDNETEGSGDLYGNYIVTFKDVVTGVNVGYSNIEVYSDSGYTTLYYDEYSNAGGVWTGLVPMNIDLYYKYPETTSYYSQSWSYNLTSSPAYKIVNLIPKSGATSTTTPTPTTTTTTITPTVTYTYNDSNLSTLNVKERFTNLLVLAGFQNAESADLIFAMIIVLGCTALIGWITLSGIGAGMGAIIGFVFSLGLGLIPLWLLIAAIFFACLYVALKLFGGSGE